MQEFIRRLTVALTCGLLLAPAPLSNAQVPTPTTAAPAAQAPATPAPRAAGPAPSASAANAPSVPLAPARPGARLAPGTPIPPAELEAFVDGAVRQGMADSHIAGVTVSVVQNGQIILRRGYGHASFSPLRPVDPDRTLFRIGSISKTFTWIAVLREAEAGRIRIDGPINLYLPEALRVPDQGMARPIRVRDLMNHTPGYEDRMLGQLFERDADRVRPLAQYLRQERPRRVREPGLLPSYSNYGAALAGLAAAETSGQPFETLIERTITGPLGMARTTFREPRPAREGLPAPMPPALAADASLPFHWTPAGYQVRPYEFIGHIAPAGSASSTASDMGRYMLAILGGGTLEGATIYGPATARAIATPLTAPSPAIDPWHHGFIRYPLPGGFTGVGHSGGTLSFMSQMTIIPDLQLGVFISTNTDTGGALATSLPASIVEHFYATPAPPPAGNPALREIAGAYSGDWLANRRAYSGLEGFVTRLVGVTNISVTEDGALLLASAMGGTQRWAPVGPVNEGRFRSAEAPGLMQFELVDGRAVRAQTPGGAVVLERVGLWRQTGLLVNLAILVFLASLATLIGVLMRTRRDQRETTPQARASLLQTTQAVLWLLAFAGFFIFAMGANDLASVVYNWPGIPIVMASASALVAALLSIASLPFLAVIWRGGRRVESWTSGRKLRFTFTTLLFVAFSALLVIWGALEPWSG